MKPDRPIILILLLCILSACGRPSWVLPDEKMEDVLFDIHLADAEVDRDFQTFGRDELKKQELYNAVFEKHGITPQQFDTSLVWYSANLPKYVKIYESLTARYLALSDTLDNWMVVEHDRLMFASTRNIWDSVPSFILYSSSTMENTFSFVIDTIDFGSGDTYEMEFRVLGLSERVPVIANLSITLDDTTFVQQRTITESSVNALSLSLPSDRKAKALSGFIHIPVSTPQQACVTILNLIINERKPISEIFSPQAKPTRKLPRKV